MSKPVNDRSGEMSAGGDDPKGLPKWDRGNALSIFVKDRSEDKTAIVFAFVIAIVSVLFMK